MTTKPAFSIQECNFNTTKKPPTITGTTQQSEAELLSPEERQFASATQGWRGVGTGGQGRRLPEPPGAGGLASSPHELWAWTVPP